jgi:hypothetical protein
MKDWIKELCRILQKVHSVSYDYWKDPRNIENKDTYEAYAKLANKYPPIEPQVLDHLVHESKRSQDFSLVIQRGSFYLPPLPLNQDGEFVATLSIDCQLSSNKINIRIEMHRLVKGELRGIGYRFEFGHAHFHATLINKRPPAEGGETLPGCPEWLPTEIPRIPTMAKNPIALITCIIFGYYGKRPLLADLKVERKYLGELDPIVV